MIDIIEVKTKKQLSDFIKFPDELYRGNQYRVPQLHTFEKTILNTDKNPAFEFCRAKYWLAYQDKRIVGRIAGIINQKANEVWNEKNARFGWIDFIDDNNVSSALIKTVEDWGRSNGMTKIQGPMGFSDMDLEGMLVEGFDEIGTQAVIYNYPYYPKHLEENGYTKDADWVQFEIKVPDRVPDRIKRISEIVQKKYHLRPLKVKKSKDLIPYASKMFDTLNESFSDLYGFVALTQKQKDFYIKQYFSMVNPKFVSFVLDSNEDVVGFGISFTSLSAAMIKAKGKLFPTGFIHILKAMRKNDKVDMLLQGVKAEYQNKGIPAIFFAEMMQAYIDNGIKTAVSSHALENNQRAFLMFDDFESRQHLRRRSYAKQL
jgi:ribosomal protein S18 acetylase RimI-like enzyme